MSPLLMEILAKVGVGHAGSAAGGALIMEGLQTGDRDKILTGVGALLVTAGHSAFRKWRRNRAAKKQG